jgi:hypothetical protein
VRLWAFLGHLHSWDDLMSKIYNLSDLEQIQVEVSVPGAKATLSAHRLGLGDWAKASSIEDAAREWGKNMADKVKCPYTDIQIRLKRR